MLLACVVCSPAGESDSSSSWPEFHGPGRDEHLPGEGPLEAVAQSGPAPGLEILAVRPRLLGRVDRGGHDLHRRRLPRGRNGPAPDLAGKLLWKSANGQSWTGAAGGSRTTPTYNDGTLYHMNPDGRLAAFVAKTGKPLWAVDLTARFQAKWGIWAAAENVVVDGDKVLCMPGGPKGRVVALDKHTGRTLWANTEIEHSAAYCSPLVVAWQGTRQLISMTQKSVVGVDVETGKLLWSAPFVPTSPQNCADARLPRRVRLRRLRPLLRRHGAEDQLGRAHRRARLVSRRPGQLPRRRDPRRRKALRLRLPPGGKNFYCVDFLTGETRKLDKTLGKVGITSADGMIYCLNHQGMVSLLAITPGGFDIVSQFDLGRRSPNTYLAHPVVCGGRLYLRYGQNLLAYDIRR